MLVTAPTNAQVDNIFQCVHEECMADDVFREEVLKDHPAPWLRLHAHWATTPQHSPHLTMVTCNIFWG